MLSRTNPTLEMIRSHKNVLERFVTLLCGVYEEEITTVDAARLYPFKHKGSDFEHMHQHFLRVAYQSGYIWGNTHKKFPDPVPPTDWGWQKVTLDTAPTPVYTTISIILMNLHKLVMCHCKRETVKFLASAVCMGKSVWFFVNVKVCAPIVAIGVGNRQMEIDLRKDYKDVFKNNKHFNSKTMYYFHNQNTLQRHN